ncbi:hypothetical protein H2204_009512 [Knufia peltigerae]|uniref:Uncharacterized protein n=1 Tax=Knufia peltigerae TaxID=1002370 RepID=A0AA38XXW8_9EURO|nr:hypothetical protein H2204_009512 [Knufia peltigerae]
MEAAERVVILALGSETESDPGVDSDLENEVDYSPKGNALVRNPYNGRLEMWPYLEARYEAQKEAWKKERRGKKAVKEAEDQAKNPSEANDNANGNITEDGNATVHVQTNVVHQGDASASDANGDANGNTTLDGNATIPVQTNGVREDETSACNAEDGTNVTPVTTAVENGQLIVNIHADDSSANNAEDDNNITHVTIAIGNGQLGVGLHACGVLEDHVSSTDTNNPVYTPATSRVPTTTVSSSSDASDPDAVPTTDQLDDEQPDAALLYPLPMFIYNALIREFGDRPFWVQTHHQSLACSVLKRKLVLVRLCHLACLRNFAFPKIKERQGRLRGRSLLLLINHFAWVRFVVRYPGLVDRVMKYVKWLEMLENEYVQAVPYFETFWTAMECGETPGGDVLEALIEMNSKRIFLQGKIFAEEHIVHELNDEAENAPSWIEWVDRRAAKK